MKDQLVRAMTKDGFVNAVAVTTTGIVERARQIHKTLPTATAALGRLLTAASMMGNMQKVDDGSITLQLKGGGPLGRLLAVSDAEGNVRGWVENPQISMLEKAPGKLDVGAAVGSDGTLTVIRDLRMKEPYIGTIDLVSGEIAEDITAYFAQSEQIPTACALGVLVGKDQSVTAAGGYIIQLLPGAPDDIIDKIESGIQNAGAVSRLLAAGMDGQVVLETVLHGFDLEILETQPVEYRCYCSRDRVTRTLISLGRTELQAIVDDGKDIQEDDFDVDAELQKPTFSKSGDIWTLGRHRLICGDSTKEETYAALMDGRKANLVITDPPYNVNYEGSAGKIKNDNMASEKFFDFLFDAFSNMEKVMADDASIYVFHADTEGLNFRKAFDAAGFYLSGCCIWKKQSLVLGRSPYQWQHEPCLYGWKKKGKHQWYTGRKESTIWEFDKPKKNGDHPTMKPIPLLAYPIQNSSMANSVVLDPFGGSGSTLIACEQTDRICYTIELDEKFCDVIARRYIEQVGSDEKVSVLRDGKVLPFTEVANTAPEV